MFKANQNGIKRLGQVIYVSNEHSFDFEPSRNADITLMINNLYLGIDSETMLAQQVWGYSPKSSWINKKLRVPLSSIGELNLFERVEAGLSKRLIGSESWKTSFDPEIGWVCIGDENLSYHEIAVEFATNTVAVLDGEKLISIWLKPIFI